MGHEHLKSNRALIVSRALLSGVAGLLPVPYVDDLLAGAVRTALIRRLAELRQVELDANAVYALAHPAGSRAIQAASFGALALGGTRRVARRLVAGLLLLRRVDEAVDTFYLGTLFDHACFGAHTGGALDGAGAARLRMAMDAASHEARSHAVEGAFRRGLTLVAQATVGLGRGAHGLWGRGPVGHVVSAATEPLLRRAAQLVEAELLRARPDHLTVLVEAFERAWKRAVPA
jgi:hypothetical protein